MMGGQCTLESAEGDFKVLIKYGVKKGNFSRQNHEAGEGKGSKEYNSHNIICLRRLLGVQQARLPQSSELLLFVRSCSLSSFEFFPSKRRRYGCMESVYFYSTEVGSNTLSGSLHCPTFPHSCGTLRRSRAAPVLQTLECPTLRDGQFQSD